VATTFPQSEEESISKAQQFELIYSQSGYLYMVLLDTLKPMPFSQDKPGMYHSTDELIGTTTHHNRHLQQPPMYGTPQYHPIYFQEQQSSKKLPWCPLRCVWPLYSSFPSNH
jgi:hypothetical protein